MIETDIKKFLKILLEKPEINNMVELLCNRYNDVCSNIENKYLDSISVLADNIINISNEFLLKEEQLKKTNVTLELYDLSEYVVNLSHTTIYMLKNINELKNIIHIPRFNGLILKDKDVTFLKKAILNSNKLAPTNDVAPFEAEYEEWLEKYGRLFEISDSSNSNFSRIKKIIYYKAFIRADKCGFKEVEEEIEKIINEGIYLKQKKDILNSLTLKQMISITEYYNLFKKYESYYLTIDTELDLAERICNDNYYRAFKNSFETMLDNVDFKTGLSMLKKLIIYYFYNEKTDERKFMDFAYINLTVQKEKILLGLIESLRFGKNHIVGPRTSYDSTLTNFKTIIEAKKKTDDTEKVKVKM